MKRYMFFVMERPKNKSKERKFYTVFHVDRTAPHEKNIKKVLETRINKPYKTFFTFSIKRCNQMYPNTF